MTNEKNDGPEKICSLCCKNASHEIDGKLYCWDHVDSAIKLKHFNDQWLKYCNGNKIQPLTENKDHDPVNHPKHYTRNGIEVIDFIEAYELGFRLGNAVKYIARAGEKDPAKRIEDLKKARWYLDREIAKHDSK